VKRQRRSVPYNPYNEYFGCTQRTVLSGCICSGHQEQNYVRRMLGASSQRYIFHSDTAFILN
jgi:hypothetical protein